MSEISFDKHRSPVKAALLYLVLWELATVIIWLFTAKLFVIETVYSPSPVTSASTPNALVASGSP